MEREDTWRTGPPVSSATVWGPYRNSFKRGDHQGHRGFANEKLRGREYSKGMGGPDPAWLVRRRQLRVENLG